MLFRTLVALVGATVPAALANFQSMNAPAVIAPGSPFNISGGYGVSDKGGEPLAVLLGVFFFNSTEEPAYYPDIKVRARLGEPLAPFDVKRIGEIWPYYFNFTGFVVPTKLVSEWKWADSLYLQWFQVTNAYTTPTSLFAQSFLMGPIKLGSEVSSKTVPATFRSYGIVP